MPHACCGPSVLAVIRHAVARGLCGPFAVALRATAPEYPRTGALSRPLACHPWRAASFKCVTVCGPPLHAHGARSRTARTLFMMASVSASTARLQRRSVLARFRRWWPLASRPAGPAPAHASAPASVPRYCGSPAGSHPLAATSADTASARAPHFRHAPNQTLAHPARRTTGASPPPFPGPPKKPLPGRGAFSGLHTRTHTQAPLTSPMTRPYLLDHHRSSCYNPRRRPHSAATQRSPT
jgi:hypothetical protein